MAAENKTPLRALRNAYVENMQKMSTPVRIPASPFMESLGFGTAVGVYRLERQKYGEALSPWAIKKINPRVCNSSNPIYKERIVNEAEILRKLSHPNIVGFRALTQSRDGNKALALECLQVSLGDLLEKRAEDELGPLPSAKILKVIDHIARALDYLHTEAKILHGDVKSYNILIKDDFAICKLCDFGVSLPLNETGCIEQHDGNQYIGTSLWSAPEVLDHLDLIGPKADIFSFGLVIYETLALVAPHMLTIPGVSENSANETNVEENKENSKSNSEVEEGIDQTDGSIADELIYESALGTRPVLPHGFEFSEDYNRILEYFFCCTNELPAYRPTAEAIWKSLQPEEELIEKQQQSTVEKQHEATTQHAQ